MSQYYICNPVVVNEQPNVLFFILIDASNDTISQGDQQFIEALVADVGITEPKAVSWEVNACRTNFYSDDLDSDDWRDRWPVVRNVAVTFDRPVVGEVVLGSLIDSDAIEESWSREVSTVGTSDPALDCVVITILENLELLNLTKAAIERDEQLADFRVALGAGNPLITILPLPRDEESPSYGYWQLHVNLGKFTSAFYEDGADYAERVIEICEEVGNAFICYADLD